MPDIRVVLNVLVLPRLRAAWRYIVLLFRRDQPPPMFFHHVRTSEPTPKRSPDVSGPLDQPPPPDIVPLLAMDIVPPPERPPLPPPGTRAKWAKPKGLDLLAKTPRVKPDPSTPKPPPRPRAPRPQTRADNPEQWGQYYFRDAILDQLDNYFIYLKRMRHSDRDAYELHRRLGIQIMPQSAVQSFDDWRSEGGMDELSAWWLQTRPGFGAISYGLDRASLREEDLCIVDLSPEEEKLVGEHHNRRDDIPKHRIGTITAGKTQTIKKLGDKKFETGTLWVPKFLYFSKYTKAPPEVQKVADGDVYSMTVWWDRVGGNTSRAFVKRHKGGIPQDYAVCVEKTSGKVRILRMLLRERLRLRSRRGGNIFSIPNTHWGLPTDYLAWACGRLDASPEDYLRRCFIEAALMYESAALGSMIRIEVTKGNLVAAFGVEIKRTSYFFKDRDITAATLTERGTRKPIFHIVRPHVRHTKTGEHPVKMQFRGLTEFEWAGYKVRISVPGRDHFLLPEFDVPIAATGKKPSRSDAINAAELGDHLNKHMREGLGAWKAKER